MTSSHRLAQVARRITSLNRSVQRRLQARPVSEYAQIVPENYADLRAYQGHFPNTAQAFRLFIDQCNLPATRDAGDPVGIVVSPWVGTPVPWYSLALGLGLARLGRSVTIIWDDTVFPVASPFLDLQNHWIGQVLEPLRRHFSVIRLSSEQPGAPQAADTSALDHLLHLNLVWALKAGTPDEEALRVAQVTLDHMRHSLGQIRGLLSRSKFRYLLMAGGIYGTSGLFQLAAGQAHVRAATFDSGLGWVVVCPDGVVAHQSDIRDAFEAIYDQPSEDLAGIHQAAREEFDKRREGLDQTGYQSVGPTPGTEMAANSVLIPLSVESDSSALGRHHIFADTADWLRDTVTFVLERSDAPVVVRQHPSERRELERTHFEIETLLGERYGHQARYHFIRAEQPINTYSLLASARLVLPYISTIGIEAAAMGKPVLLAGNPAYGTLGFAHSAASRQEYFGLLQQALDGTLPTLPDQTRRAWVCYYLNAVCYRVFTDFGPQPTDFWKWCQKSPAMVYAEPGVTDILKALDEGVSLALVRHRRRTAPAQHLLGA